jgi:hypothetical protein
MEALQLENEHLRRKSISSSEGELHFLDVVL